MPRRASNDINDNDDKHEAGAGFSTPEGGCMRNVLGQRRGQPDVWGGPKGHLKYNNRANLRLLGVK